MTETIEYRRVGHTLPDYALQALGSSTTDMRDAYMHSLRSAGWTLQSIAEGAGITRERVRQIVAKQPTDSLEILELPPVPEIPRKVQKTPRQYVEPDPAKLARMLELQAAAQSVRANSERGRVEAEEYTNLIAESHLQDGVSLYRLAKRLGVSHGALRFRLARYGHKSPANGGSSRVYAPILDANRALPTP